MLIYIDANIRNCDFEQQNPRKDEVEDDDDDDDDDDVEYHSDLASNTWDSANKNGVFHQQTTLTNDN